MELVGDRSAIDCNFGWIFGMSFVDELDSKLEVCTHIARRKCRSASVSLLCFVKIFSQSTCFIDTTRSAELV